MGRGCLQGNLPECQKKRRFIFGNIFYRDQCKDMKKTLPRIHFSISIYFFLSFHKSVEYLPSRDVYANNRPQLYKLYELYKLSTNKNRRFLCLTGVVETWLLGTEDMLTLKIKVQ